MKRRDALTPREMVAPVAAAGACAILLAVTLSVIAAPGALSERLASLSARADEVGRELKSVRTPSSSDLRLVCLGPAAQAESDLQRVVSETAGQQSVTLSDLHLDAGAPAAGGVRPVVVHFTGTGSYEGVTAVLRRLATYRSSIFVDEADLISNTSSVTLNFTGRMFCAA